MSAENKHRMNINVAVGVKGEIMYSTTINILKI